MPDFVILCEQWSKGHLTQSGEPWGCVTPSSLGSSNSMVRWTKGLPTPLMLHMEVKSSMTQRSLLRVHLKPETWGAAPSCYLRVGIMPLRVSMLHLCIFLNPHSLVQLNRKREAALTPTVQQLFAGTLTETEPVMPKVMLWKYSYWNPSRSFLDDLR